MFDLRRQAYASNSPTHPPTHPLTHSLPQPAPLLARSLAHSLTRSLQAYAGNVVCIPVHQVKACQYKPIQLLLMTDDLEPEGKALIEQVGQWRHTAFPIPTCKNINELVANEDDKYGWLFGAFGEELLSHDRSLFNEVLADCGGYEQLNMDRSSKSKVIDAFLVEDTACT